MFSIGLSYPALLGNKAVQGQKGVTCHYIRVRVPAAHKLFFPLIIVTPIRRGAAYETAVNGWITIIIKYLGGRESAVGG